MSFSSEQKNNIINQPVKSACCRRSFLCGVLFAKGSFGGENITLSIERREYAELVVKLVREFYGRIATVSASQKGGRCVIVAFESASAANYIRDISEKAVCCVEKCPACASAFLRGVFLASGRISDPEKQYSLEFSLGIRSAIFAEYLRERGLIPLVSNKTTGSIVYFRNSSQIEELLGHAGMNTAMFNIIDARFNGEARKNLMRALNCETNNMQKTVNAAVEQCKLIERLENANLLSSLPDEIAAVARLRMDYPDYSLSQLAAVATPSITKSGLAHRLKKLMELGEGLLHKG